MSKEDMYMSDEEYLKILEKIVETVDAPDFKPEFYDDNTIGSKRTWSNCGLCNDDENSTFATKENVAFPDQFPGRRDFKYFKDNQQCPFDFRKIKGVNGCFFTCYLFKNKWSSINVESIKRMAHKRLDDAKAVLG